MSCGHCRLSLRERPGFRWKRIADTVLRAILALAALLSFAHAARGQAAWEYSPYQVRVRIALEAAPQLPADLIESLGQQIVERADSVHGAVWSVESLAASGHLRDALLVRLDELTADEIAALAPGDLNGDKLLLVALASQASEYGIAVREFDCRSRQLGPLVERTAAAPRDLPLAVWDGLAECFTPLVRIEDVEEKKIVARLRAGGLIVDPASRALVEPGMVLRPVVRRNDRSGEPVKGGIQAISWTLIEVDARRDALLDCTLHSGFRAPIPARGGVRTERLALLVRPIWESTRLVLQARDNPNKRLAGYEIHLKIPGEEESQPLGATDDFGAIDLPREQGGLRLLYVRSGRQLLARLPIVFGQAEALNATVVDDDARLQAEGFVAALHARALDLVARREILASRIRKRIEEAKLPEAQKLLDEFRKLESRADLSRDLDAQQRQVETGDRLTQARVDKLFSEAQKLLLSKALSDEMLNELTRELAAGRTASQQASTN